MKFAVTPQATHSTRQALQCRRFDEVPSRVMLRLYCPA